MIRALFKFDKHIPKDVAVIDTTSSSGDYKELSPFILPASPAKNFENLWQFSKVYRQYADSFQNPIAAYFEWRERGYSDKQAHRYPMGKGAIPLYSLWENKRLEYIDARKQIYAPEYAKNVVKTDSYHRLQTVYSLSPKELILLDYDAYDHMKLGMSLIDVINNPNRKMGHAFVLIMMLTGLLEECIKS